MERTVFNTPKRKLIDTQSYVRIDNLGNRFIDEKAMNAGFAAASIETDKTKSIESRIWRTLLVVAPDGRVIDMRADRKNGLPDDVRRGFSRKNDFDAKESQTGDKSIELLLTSDVSECSKYFCYISPPTKEDENGNNLYNSARLGVGRVFEKMGFKILEQYGIPLDLTNEDCLNLAYLLKEFENLESNGVVLGEDPENLRGEIIELIFFLDNDNWIEFFQRLLPGWKNLWNQIQNGSVAKENRSAISKSREINKKNDTVAKLMRAKKEREYVEVGAEVETGLQKNGYFFFSDNCGLTNKSLLKPLELFETQPIKFGGGVIDLKPDFVTSESDAKGSLWFQCPLGHWNKRQRDNLNSVCDSCPCELSCRYFGRDS